MKTIKKNAISVFFLTLFLSLTVLSFAAKNMNAERAPSKTVVEIAIADDRFSILVEAVSKAGLVDALNAEGPYTVFAPTNDAFEVLFKDLGVKGVEDLTAEQLRPILLYHVVSGKVLASGLSSGKVATLNEDAWIMVDVDKSGVTINESSKVVVANVEGSNGVIHVINKVLVPETKTSAVKKSSSGCN